jgi:hypothetical protein
MSTGTPAMNFYLECRDCQLYFAIYFPHRTDFLHRMTARPSVPESRRWPLSPAVALVLVAAMVMAAGCIEPGYRPDNDIVIVKITPDATVEWTKVIDSGGNDEAYRIIQTPDENLALYASLKGENFTGLMKISRKTGEILWKTPLVEMGCGSGLTAARNGDILSTGGVNICRINSDGSVVWNRSTELNGFGQTLLESSDGYVIGGGQTDWHKSGTEIRYDKHGNLTPRLSEQDKRKNGIPVTQATVARLDAEGNLLWQTFLGQYDVREPVRMIVHLENNRGYIACTAHHVIRLDEGGKYISRILIDTLPAYDNGTSAGQNQTYSVSCPSDFVFYDSQGEAVTKKTISNVTVVIRTEGGGFFAAGFPGPTQLSGEIAERAQDGNLHVVKFKSDGTKDQETSVQGVLVNSVGQIIQTSDGGYAILGGNDKEWR